MKRYLSFAITIFFMVVLSFCLSTPVMAVSCFSDVEPDYPWLEGLEYLAEHKIVIGTGNAQFSLDAPITVRQ